MDRSPCPPNQELRAFERGCLSGDEYVRVEKHIQSCDACLERLQASEESDELMNTLANLDLDVVHEPGMTRALHLAREIDSVSTEPAYPARVGPYRLDRVLGHGAMGAVYEAIDERSSLPCAVKLLSHRESLFTPSVQRFQRESSLIKRLRHKNVVQALDAGCESEVHFLVMERLNGVDLSKLLRKEDRLRVPDACEIARQIASGLCAIHAQGLVHRDIKPSNAMLVFDKDGHAVVKVLDLGLAQVAEFARVGDGRLTATNEILGTVDYMAPEQGGPFESTDPRADIYSLGATLYKLLSGEVPFGLDQPMSVLQRMRQIASHEPVPLGDRVPYVDSKLADFIHQMIARDREQRPFHAKQIVDFLSPFCDAADLGELLRQTLIKTPPFDGQSNDSLAVESASDSLTDSQPNRRSLWTFMAVAAIGSGFLIHRANQPTSRTGFESRTDGPRTRPTQGVPPGRTELEPFAILKGHTDNIFGIRFLDATSFVSASWDGTIRCWDAAQGKRIWSVSAPQNPYLVSLAISADRKLIAVGTPAKNVFVLDAKTGATVHLFATQDLLAPITGLSFSTDDRFLTTVSDSGVFQTFDLADGSVAGRFEQRGGRRRIAYLSENLLLVGARTQGPSLTILDPQTGRKQIEFERPPLYCNALVAIDQKQFAIACPSGHLAGLSIWNVDETKYPQSHIESDAPLEDLDIASDVNRIVAGSVWRQILVGEIQQQVRWIREGNCKTQATQRVAISPDGKWLASGGGWRVNQRLQSDGDFDLRVWQLS